MKIPTQAMVFLLGGAGGAFALVISGFSWGGWLTRAGSEAAAENRAEAAVIAALTPICVASVQASVDLPVHLQLLKRMNSWERGPYLERGGWATMPGGKAALPGVALACAEQLGHELVVD